MFHALAMKEYFSLCSRPTNALWQNMLYHISLIT